MNKDFSEKRGSVLILTFIIIITLTVVVVAFLYMTSTQLRGSAYDIASSKAFWLAEAGIQKAIWNLKTPIASGGEGEDWTTTGETESLGDGNYKMVVARYDFALADNGSSASDSPQQSAPPFKPDKAIDGSDSTHWRSPNRPTAGNPQRLIITFPYLLTINKVRFLSTNTQSQPVDYTYEVSTNGTSYSTVVTKMGNTTIDITDEFTSASSVRYLRLSVTKAGRDRPSTRVRVATLEAIGRKISSSGTVSGIKRKIEETVVTDDATQSASDEIDWNEIVPAT